MSSISDPPRKDIVLNLLGEHNSSAFEDDSLLKADREIEEYKQQLDDLAHLKETKRQRNKQLVNIAKITVYFIIFIYLIVQVIN